MSLVAATLVYGGVQGLRPEAPPCAGPARARRGGSVSVRGGEVAYRVHEGGPGVPLLADAYLGRIGRDVVNVLLLSSLFACVLSFHNVVARYQFVLANEGLLPERLGQVHPGHGSPAFSSIVQTVTALALLLVFAALGLDPLVGVFGSMAGGSVAEERVS